MFMNPTEERVPMDQATYEGEKHEQVKEGVYAAMRSVLSTEEVPPSATLADLGMNSLSFIRMVVELERTCKMRFDDEDIDYARFHDVDDVVRYVVAAVTSADA
jgi:acyl carrier protein